MMKDRKSKDDEKEEHYIKLQGVDVRGTGWDALLGSLVALLGQAARGGENRLNSTTCGFGT